MFKTLKKRLAGLFVPVPNRPLGYWELCEAGVPTEHIGACYQWAFGDGWETMLAKDMDIQWNNRHSDIFIATGLDERGELLKKIGKTYIDFVAKTASRIHNKLAALEPKAKYPPNVWLWAFGYPEEHTPDDRMASRWHGLHPALPRIDRMPRANQLKIVSEEYRKYKENPNDSKN